MTKRYETPAMSAITRAAAPMIGGMIWPPLDAVASIPPAKAGLKPRCLISGIVKVPVPTMLATVLPDIVPNRLEATMAAWAGPPRVRRVARKENFSRVSPAPVPSSITPNRMKISTMLITMLVIVPKMPLLRLYQIFSASWSGAKPEWRRMPGRSAPNRM